MSNRRELSRIRGPWPDGLAALAEYDPRRIAASLHLAVRVERGAWVVRRRRERGQYHLVVEGRIGTGKERGIGHLTDR